jgi:hypothetical protein
MQNIIKKCDKCGKENVQGGAHIVESLPVGMRGPEMMEFYLNAEYEDICSECAVIKED